MLHIILVFVIVHRAIAASVTVVMMEVVRREVPVLPRAKRRAAYTSTAAGCHVVDDAICIDLHSNLGTALDHICESGLVTAA